MNADFRTNFTREPGALRHWPGPGVERRLPSAFPTIRCPCGPGRKPSRRPIWSASKSWRNMIRSCIARRFPIRIPSVVVLKDYVKPQKRVAFTRFNLFLRDEFCCQYCGARGRTDL